MESSTAEERELACNVVQVAAAKLPFRVDSTTQLFPGSPESAGGCDDHDDDLPSVSSRVPWNTTAASTTNCGVDTLGCFPPRYSEVGLPAVTPQRPAVTVPCYADMKVSASDIMPPTNHNISKPISDDASLSHDVSSGGADTVVDDMATFRAALDAVDPSALVGLRRARSKSVLVPVYRPPPAAVRFRSRGSVQCDQVTRDDHKHTDDDTQSNHHHRPFQQQQQTAKAVQTSVSYSRERFRSASLATQRSRRSRDSASMSEMCLEYMLLNGIVPRYLSYQQHDDGVMRSSYMSLLLRPLLYPVQQ